MRVVIIRRADADAEAGARASPEPGDAEAMERHVRQRARLAGR